MGLNARAFGLACGLLLGVAGLLGTLLSLWFGGGQTITLLAAVYFGYSWSVLGALLALVWGFVYGFVGGWIFASLYNRFAAS